MHWYDWIELMVIVLWVGCLAAQVYLVGYQSGRDSREEAVCCRRCCRCACHRDDDEENAAPGEKEGA